MPSDTDRPEGNDVVISKGECPKCGSSKGFVTYADGHSHCYGAGCGHYVAPSEAGMQNTSSSASPSPTTFTRATSKLLDPAQQSSPFSALSKRGLTSETLRKAGIFQAGYSGQAVQVYPYYDQDGSLAVQKLRFPNKEFVALKEDGAPSLSKCQLFMRPVFGDRYDRTLVVCEGELDAASVAQAVDWKLAVVSINTGAASAADSLKANYLWVDRFKEIILWFDDDAPGRLATEECAALFKVGKIKVAKAFGMKLDSTTETCKDASDILQARRPGDITTAIYKAAAWRPRGIINAATNVSDVLAPRERQLVFHYPLCMSKLDEMSGGMCMGDVIYHVAGTGVGKSSVLREIQYGLVEQKVKVGILNFEDTTRDAKLGLMSIHASERLALVPLPDPEDLKAVEAYDKRMTTIHAQVFGGGMVELFDPVSAEWSMDAILGYIRYCAKGLDCQVIFIDPISFIAAGIDLSADERRVLDKVAGELAKLAKELNIHLQISHHLKRTQGVPHEEGAPTSLNELRSSGGLANFAMGVIGWERNNQAAGEAWRVIRARVIKSVRRTGKSGLADTLYYREDGRYVVSHLEFPPIGKPEGGDARDGAGGRPGGFSDVSGNGDY